MEAICRSSQASVKRSSETVYAKDLGQTCRLECSVNIQSSYHHPKETWPSVPWDPVFVVLSLFWKVAMGLLFITRIGSTKTSACTHVLCDRIAHQSERSSFSRALMSPGCGILTTRGLFWLHLAEGQWEGGCQCQVVTLGTGTTHLQPLESTASKSFQTIRGRIWVLIVVKELSIHIIC